MNNRLTFAFYIALIIFGVFVLRLWYLQVIKGDEYRKIAEGNRLRVVDIPAPRGVIYDRNNNALVRNVLSFDISMVKENIPKDAGTLSELGQLVGLMPEDIKRRARSTENPFEAVKLRQNVSFEEVAKIDARRIDFPGLQVDVTSARGYIFGQASAHVLGYLGNPTPKQMELPEFSNIPPQSFVGQFGLEKSYDSTLRGISGKKIVEVDALGNMIKFVRIQRPLRGNDLKLSIDIKAQLEAERALEDKTGAVVAIKPDSGEILALASAPSFDPNLFVGGIKHEDWKELINDPRKPLMNRAIQNQYPPGSTFKPVTAIAALEDGIVTENTPAFCSGSTFFKRLFRCWKKGGHGTVSLHRALVESCDVYFYEIGKRINIDTIAQYASALGLGRPTGVELDGEASGIVPSTKWKLRTRKEKWYQGETLSVAIGQGYLAVTPVQMARMIATLINGGELYKPHLVTNGNGENKPESVAELNPEYVEMIKSALVGVVYEGGGTGSAARSGIVSIGGKTGTAQVIGGDAKGKDLSDQYKDHAWFIAFAPQNNPEIAVSVFVEHGGHGGSAAAPIAKRVIEAYFNPPKPEEKMKQEDAKQEEQTAVEQKPQAEEQEEQYGD